MAAIDRIRTMAFGLVACAGLLACGAGEPPPGTAMVAKHDASHVNTAPSVASLNFVPLRAAPGETVQAVATATDPDGDAVTLAYAWQIDGRRLLETGPQIRLPDTASNATVSVTVVAKDGEEESPPRVAQFRVGNRSPRVSALDIETVEVAGLRGTAPHWRVIADVHDPDGNQTSVRYEWIVNGEVVEDGTEVFAQERVVRGDVVTVRATPFDGQSHGSSLESPAIEIGNSPPEIVSSPPGLDASGMFRYEPQVHDRDEGDRLSYRLLEGPPGMQIDPASGMLVWQPTASNVGSHQVAFEVSDPHDGHSRQLFQVKVEVGGKPSPGPASPR